MNMFERMNRSLSEKKGSKKVFQEERTTLSQTESCKGLVYSEIAEIFDTAKTEYVADEARDETREREGQHGKGFEYLSKLKYL